MKSSLEWAQLVENKSSAGRRFFFSLTYDVSFVLQRSGVILIKGAVSVLISGWDILQEKQLGKNIYKWRIHKIPSWDNSVAVSAITPEVNLFRGLQQCTNPKVNHSKNYGLLLQLVKWWTQHNNWDIPSIIFDKNGTLSFFQNPYCFFFFRK